MEIGSGNTMKISAFIPPILTRLLLKALKKQYPVWEGDFKSWDDAKKQCSGYDAANILNSCAESIRLVVNGQAVYERDSVIFNEKQYSWPLISTLLSTALQNNNKLCVIDFGGSLGSTFYQNKELLKVVDKVDWCIIEQENFVQKGRAEFETDQLHFFYNFKECLEKFNPNIILLSSVLQYLEDPYFLIDEIKRLNIESILIDRNSFIEASRDYVTKQNVPETIYTASYPMWFFNQQKFLEAFSPEYVAEIEFESYCDKPTTLNNKFQISWKGFLLRKTHGA